MKRTHTLLAAFAALALALPPARAASVVWSGSDSVDWNDAANWSGSTVPTETDAVIINNGFGPVIDTSGTGDMIYINGLTIATGGAGLGSLSLVNSASVTVTAETRLGQQSTGTTTISLSGSSYLFVGNMQSGGDGNTSQYLQIDITDNAYLGVGGQLLFYGGTTTLNASGASTLNVTNFRIGRTGQSHATATFSGSSTLIAGLVEVGYVFGNGFLNFTDHATGTVMGNMLIGVTDARGGATASYVDLSGSAQLNIIGTLNVGNYGRGEINIHEHATVTADNVIVGALRSTGSLHGNGVIGLHGNDYGGRGTLISSTISRGTGAAGMIHFNGGILRANTDNAEFLNANSDTLTVFIDEEGGYIDSNGFNIGFSPGVVVSGSEGAFNKIGAGNLTLFGTVTHTGEIVVQEGAIILTQPHQLASSGAVRVEESSTIRAANLDQTLGGLSGNGLIDLDTGALTLNNDEDSAFFGEIIAAGGLIKTGTAAITLHGDNTLGTDTTLSGGRLGIASSGALGTTTVTITGDGSLRADANVSIANSIRAENASLNFDTLGDVTMSINGAVTGTQGIIKEGVGAINLAGDSSGVTGAVNVNEGTLTVNGLGAGSTVNIAHDAGFGGSGVVNASVTYAGSGALQLGATHNDSLITSPVTLTIANTLTLGDTIIKFDTFGVNASDKLVADSIVFGGQTNIDFSILRQGTFTLMQTTGGTLDPSLPSSITTHRTGLAGSSREHIDYTLSPDQKTLSATITKTNEALTWTGAAGDIWDYNNTASWTGNDTAFVDGDRVSFAASGPNTVAVDGNNVTAGDMTVTGGGDYTFTGDGRITTDAASTGAKGAGFGDDATGKFTMQGTGTVTFANASNVFLGGLDVLSGVVIGNADSLGKNADITTTGEGTVIFRQDTNTSYLGSLHGNGHYAKTGAGVLTFTSANSTATGVFAVNEGSLLLAEGAKLGDIAIADGAIFGGSGEAVNVRAEGGSTVRVGIAIAGAQVGTETLKLGALSLANTARIIGSGTLDADITIDSAATAVAEIAENREIVLAGTLGGAGGLTKQGAGALVFTQQADYAGATTVMAGTLRVAGPNLLSANSAHIIKAGGVLMLNGCDQTIHSLVNEGSVSITNGVSVGTRLTLMNGYSGAANSIITMSLRAADNTPTVTDQIVVQNGGITGQSKIIVNVIDQRATPAGAYLNDIPALVVNENGDMPTKVFTVSDGTSNNRVIIGDIDYRLYYFGNEARLVATDSAETPAVLAVNPISIAVNRATLNSLSRHLDYLHDTQTLADNQDRGKNLWLQGYYRRDRFYDEYWADTSGVQIGFDIPTDTANGGTVVYGIFADYTRSKIDLDNVFNNPSVELTSKSLGAYMLLRHDAWCVDFAAKYSWDDYTVDVIDTPEFDMDGSSWAGFMRVSYVAKLKNNWTLVPQTQLIFQARGVDNAVDAYGRKYSFGQKYARIDESNSLEGRLSLSARKLITLKNGKILQPYLTVGYYYDFKGDMTVTSVNETEFHDDLGGGSIQVNTGFSAQLGKNLTAIIDAAFQNGGEIESYSINASLNLRW